MMNPKIDRLINHAKKWKEEMSLIREIALETGLTEELKWRLPCYTLNDSNVAIIQPFKEYCAIMFFKGALLKDTKKLLKTPGTSQAVRQLRFEDLAQVQKQKAIIKSYIKEAIKLDKSGAKVELKETKDFDVPAEFQAKLDKNAKLKKAFASLTPGRQRAYLYFFGSAKQTATREARVKKFEKQILAGKGMND